MKGVVVVLDGVADEPLKELGGKTPLEVAKTKNLDEIASKSEIMHSYVIKKGVAPESSAAVVSLFGYNPNEISRGPLEALGLNVKIGKGDMVFRCNFGTIDNLENKKVIDRRVGRTLKTEESRLLAEAINSKLGLFNGYETEFISGVQHRGALIIRGNFNANITNIDSAYTKEGATGIVSGKFNFAKPLDKKEDSKIVADLVNNFVRESFKILNEHNVNKERIRNGLLPANFIFCRGGGQLRKLKKLHGKWMALGYMPLEIGIANVFRMKTCRFTYPELKGIDVYPNLYEGLKKAIKTAKEMLEKNKNKIDYFYIHFKETDVPGHDGKAEEKIKMIEIIDKEFFSFLKKFIGDNKLIILPDHTTSCKKRAHSFEAVPVLIYPSQIENEKRFIEREGMKGKRVEWDKIIKNNLLK